MPERTARKFPLREYYVQLEWKKKIRTVMGNKTVTLTSIHDLIKHLTLSDSDAGSPGVRSHHRERGSSYDSDDSGVSEDEEDSMERARHTRDEISSIIIEGKKKITLDLTCLLIIINLFSPSNVGPVSIEMQ